MGDSVRMLPIITDLPEEALSSVTQEELAAPGWRTGGQWGRNLKEKHGCGSGLRSRAHVQTRRSVCIETKHQL